MNETKNKCSYLVLLVAVMLIAWGCQSADEEYSMPPDADPVAEATAASEAAEAELDEHKAEAKKKIEKHMGDFTILEEDGRLWVLGPGEEKEEKHVTLIGAGPNGETIKALSRENVLLYLSHKPGFRVELEDGKLWALRPGQEISEKRTTLIGEGPMGISLCALDKGTALEYLATREGFVAKADEDERIWIFKEGAPTEMSEKHITLIGAGPMGTTLKAVDRETLDLWQKAD